MPARLSAKQKARRRVTACRKQLRRALQHQDALAMQKALEGAQPSNRGGDSADVVEARRHLQQAVMRYQALP